MPNIIHLILATTFIFGSAPSPTAISGQGQSPWFESNAPSAGTVPLCHPYGDTKTEEGSLAVSRKFTGKELDEETGLYNFLARFYDPKTGRFITADPVDFSDVGIKLAGGKDLLSFLTNPQNLNRYTYCLNNPIRYIDPDGLLTVLIHGTHSKSNMFNRDFIKSVEDSFGERHATVAFRWSGGNTDKARASATRNLASFINKYNFAEGENLNIVAHSHGGNVAFIASQQKLKHKIDKLVTLGTPIREYKPNMNNIGKVYNVYSRYDKVQSGLGGNKYTPFGQEIGPAGHVLAGVININIPVNKGPIGTHGYLHTNEAWGKYIDKAVKDN